MVSCKGKSVADRAIPKGDNQTKKSKTNKTAVTKKTMTKKTAVTKKTKKKTTQTEICSSSQALTPTQPNQAQIQHVKVIFVMFVMKLCVNTKLFFVCM